MITVAWKKSTSASAPGSFTCGTITSAGPNSSRLRRPTYLRTVDSATSKPSFHTPDRFGRVIFSDQASPFGLAW